MKTSTYTPFDVTPRDRIVGFFVIGAVLLFLIGFLIPFIQKLSNEEGLPYYTVLDKTYGIAPDAIVSMRGVTIGKVVRVGITQDAMVRVDIALSHDYADFYTNKSSLTVDTNIGVSTILTGSGLILSPGKSENGLMALGGFIFTSTPQGFSSILEEIDIVQLTDQITEIVNNVEEITTGLAENQDKLYRSLDNLEKVTTSLAQVSAEIPQMIKSVDESLASLQSSMRGVDKLIEASSENLQLALKNTVQLTEQATLTLAETETLFQATTPVMNQLPTVLVTTDIALQSITQLTEQMSQSWLLGGGESSETKQPIMPSGHPHDNNLYKTTPRSSQ
jgi:ABC-type transporter Mla subunit MlaD